MPEPTPSGPETPTAQPVGNAPSAAGMMTPQAPQGETEAAKLDIYHAMKLIDRAIGRFGQSDDGEYALKVRAMLTQHFGEHEDTSEEFSPAELKRMLASLAGPGQTPTPSPSPQGAQAPPQ
jgi:hypothetical protein